EGEVVGAMTFQITGYVEKLVASTFYTTNSVGRYQLLDWIGRHTDQVKEAVVELQPDVFPELWFRDLGATVRSDSEYSWPGPMARIVDVARLTGIGAGEGSVTLDIHDALCPWNEGRFTFRAESGTLVVEPGGEAGDRITIQGLSALVYMGIDPADLPFRGWGEPSIEAQAALRRLFPSVIPHIHEKF
ncbi:MAG TPA: sterol carrier protein domain-containing protein, partial [Thermomicrobiales bacterium]|nr:sterol carrier protein domain-containing protein [Thermomicrobiales bacterium]